MSSKNRAVLHGSIYLIFGGIVFIITSFELKNIVLLLPGILVLSMHKIFDNMDIRMADVLLRFIIPLLSFIVVLLVF